VAVVPDMAAALGTDIYIITVLAYLIFGSLISGTMAWIGVNTGQELIVVVSRLFGCRGKKIAALTILSVCLPASILTGGFYAGWVINLSTGLSLNIAAPICILFFSVLAAGQAHELLKISNYIALLLVPAILIMMVVYGFGNPEYNLDYSKINWLLVSALIGYNAGGMRSALIVETAAHLSRKGYKAIFLVVLAKLVEGLFTLALTHLILLAGIQGPVAIANAAAKIGGLTAFHIFNLILFCTFTSAMVPAMTVNARQIRIVTGLSFRKALLVATGIVGIGHFLGFGIIIKIMGFTGIIMIAFTIYTAYAVHKYGLNHS